MGPTSRVPSSDGIRVLHVDDDPNMTEVVAEYLERERDALTVDTECDASVGLSQLDDAAYDCIVSDYQMPGMDGMEFLREVREEYPDVPFVLFTGEGSENIAGTAISAGVTDYIQKGGTEQYALLANRVVNAVDQYRTTRTLRRQTDLFEKTQHLANVGGWEYDLRTDRLSWSDGMYRILGADRRSEPSLEDIVEFVHPDDRETVRSKYRRAVDAGEPYDVELRFVHGDTGETRWMRINGEPQYEDGVIVRVRGTTQDVTDRKRRERRLQRHAETIEALHRAATDITDADTVEEVGRRTVRAARELLDFRICSVLYYRDGWLEPIAVSDESPADGARRVPVAEDGTGGIAGRSYRTGESYVLDDVRSEDPSEPAKDAYQSGISVPIGDHGVFQAVAFERAQFDSDDVDRAELLAAHAASAFGRLDRERELQERNERLDQFASVVSHDLRNPIQVAKGALELASATGDQVHLDDAEASIDRMDRIVTDLLTIAREGEAVTDPQPTALGPVVEESWGVVETDGAVLETEGLEDRVVPVDVGRLGQLLENLFRNAVEHGVPTDSPGTNADREDEGGGSLTVRVGWMDGPEPGFYVADDGDGMPESLGEEVFEMGVSEREGGTGFGLAIVERVATTHGWSVAVGESETGGARFEVTGLESS